MDIVTLKGLIQTALRSTPFSISGATLSSSDITALFIAHFGRDDLVLSAAQHSETAASITVTGTMARPYLGASSPTATATFTVVAGQPETTAVVSGFPAAWTLTTAFPALKDTLFDCFRYALPSFTLTSGGSSALPAAFPSQYGMPAYPERIRSALAPGLSFQATAKVSSGLTGIEWLLGGNSWALSGPIGTSSTLPSIALTSPAGTAIPIGQLSLSFSLALAAAALVVPGDSSPPTFVCSVLQFQAEIEKDLATGKLKIPVFARTFSPSLNTVMITGELADLAPLTLPDVAALIGADLSGQIPPSFPVLDDIGLRSVSLSVAPATPALISATVVIAFQPHKGTWSIFDGMIVFDGMAVSFTWIPSDNSISTSVEAVATIAGGTLAAGVSLPETYFWCELEKGSIDISKIVTKIAGNTISMPAINCTALDFSGSVADNVYRFQATVTDDWQIKLPGSTRTLAITQIGMDLTYASHASSPLTGQVIGTFNIAGTSLFASAEYDGSSGGWTFAGGTIGTQSIDVNLIVDDVLSLFGIHLPGKAPKVTLTNLNISFNTATHAFTFMGMASVTIAGKECDLGIRIARDQSSTVFNGYVWIGDDTFELDFATGAETVLVGKWTALEGSSSQLSLDRLIAALDLQIDLPSSLDLTLTGAAIVYDATNDVVVLIGDMASGSSLLFIVSAKPTKQIGFAALSKQGLNLSDLPLVGNRLAKIATIAIDQLQISVSDAPLAKAGAAFNTLVESYAGYLTGLTYPAFPPLPVQATTKAYLSATFDYGAGTLPFALALDGGTTTGAGALIAGATTLAANGSGGPVTSSATSDGTTWFNVQRSFGPVTIERIGAMYQSGAQTLWFALDATLAFGPLSLSLVGLGLGSPIKSFKAEFMLTGLGISYAEPPLTISGSLVNRAPPESPHIDLEGGISIATGDFTITAFGYYGDDSGFPSMFMFGDVAYDFGGPAAFFVTGLALGFGYNSAVRIPTIDEVGSFPFVAVLPTSMAPNPGIFGGANPTPLQALNAILDTPPPWVAATKGSLWFAAGITFTSFELVNSQALIMVQPGRDLVIALIGASRAQFPQPVGGENNIPTYAYVELDLEAIFAPNDGIFSVQAVLASASFLLDRACVLTGGFAFVVWFGDNAHAGDFVLCLGGYNPGFLPPPYYPAVPRVGFHWSFDSSLTFQGGAYFALTPAALMFGGELNATYQSGNLKAWFDAHADVIVQWKPFWFLADIGITVGASYKLDLLFTTATISVELGCDLELWGPPTAGRLTVDWYIITIRIPFGDQSRTRPHAQSWSDVEAMLPSHGTSGRNPLSISPVAGLHPTTTSPPKSSKIASQAAAPARRAPWTVRGGTFVFTTSSPIPATTATIGGTSRFNGSAFNVYPLVASDAGWKNVSATHAISITRDDHAKTDVTPVFVAAPVIKSVPAGLWGSPPHANGQPQVPAGDQQLVADQIVGVTMTVNPPQIGASMGPVDTATDLAFDALDGEGILPLLASAQPTGDVAVFSAKTIGLIADPTKGIAATATVSSRGSILAALTTLSYAPATANDAMSTFATEAGRAFSAIPLLVA